MSPFHAHTRESFGGNFIDFSQHNSVLILLQSSHKIIIIREWIFIVHFHTSATQKLRPSQWVITIYDFHPKIRAIFVFWLTDRNHHKSTQTFSLRQTVAIYPEDIFGDLKVIFRMMCDVKTHIHEMKKIFIRSRNAIKIFHVHTLIFRVRNISFKLWRDS